MYRNVAGLGVVSAPVALAFTGADRTSILVAAGAAVLLMIVGVALLRLSYRVRR